MISGCQMLEELWPLCYDIQKMGKGIRYALKHHCAQALGFATANEPCDCQATMYTFLTTEVIFRYTFKLELLNNTFKKYENEQKRANKLLRG